MDNEKRLNRINNGLAKLDIEEWPSIPELALVRLEELLEAGMDGYNQEMADLVRRVIEAQKRLGEKQVRFAPIHERALNFPEDLQEDGLYPIPPRLMLPGMGDAAAGEMDDALG